MHAHTQLLLHTCKLPFNFTLFYSNYRVLLKICSNLIVYIYVTIWQAIDISIYSCPQNTISSRWGCCLGWHVLVHVLSPSCPVLSWDYCIIVVINVSCMQHKFTRKPNGFSGVLYTIYTICYIVYYNGLVFYLLVNIVVILLKLYILNV
jgi:hypothetical protein